MKPVSTQIAISQPDEPTLRIISALTINIPDPIMEPATSMVPSSRPSSCFIFDCPGFFAISYLSVKGPKLFKKLYIKAGYCKEIKYYFAIPIIKDLPKQY